MGLRVVELEDVQAQIALREVDETALVRGHVVRLRRDFTGAGLRSIAIAPSISHHGRVDHYVVIGLRAWISQNAGKLRDLIAQLPGVNEWCALR